MRRAWIGIAVLAATLAVAWPAAAQEKGQVGLVAGYPASIGVLFHVSDGVALRPAFSFSTSSGTNTYIGTSVNQESTVDGYSIGLGIDALFYVKKWDSLRAYVTPGFTWGHTLSTSKSPSFLYTNRSTTNNYQVMGSFGAQYALSKRFGVLGEVGVVYSHNNAESVPEGGTGGSSGSAYSFSSRAAIYVAYYFK